MRNNKETSQQGKKGQFQYISQEKKRRVIKTILFFMPTIILLIAGHLIYDTRENILTIFAILFCLPAAKQFVGLIIIWMYKSMNLDLYNRIHKKKGTLTMIYEAILTNYDKNTYVDAIAICGNQVVGYTSSEKADLKYAEEHTQKILRHNGFCVHVKIFKDLNPFLERMHSLNEHADSLRADIPFKPDDKYPDLSREELIRHTILTISL